ALRMRQMRHGRASRWHLPAPRRRGAPRPGRHGTVVRGSLLGAGALGRCRGGERDDSRRSLGELPGTCVSTDDHHHPPQLTEVEIRARALEALLGEKGLVDEGFIDAVVAAYENDIGPMNGARVVARAWVDPAYRQRLLADATAAIAVLGYGGP